jgi:hypothetical protein
VRVCNDLCQMLIKEGTRADVFVQFFEDFLIQMAAQLKELFLYLRLFVKLVDVCRGKTHVQAGCFD